MRAMDVMVHDVITIRPDDSIADAAKLITENSVSAQPVVANDDRLVGVITEATLFVWSCSRGLESRPGPISAVPAYK